jgi:hypothetical protein
MIDSAPYTLLLMQANPLRGQVGGGWALEIETFLGPVKWHRAVRRVPFGANLGPQMSLAATAVEIDSPAMPGMAASRISQLCVYITDGKYFILKKSSNNLRLGFYDFCTFSFSSLCDVKTARLVACQTCCKVTVRCQPTSLRSEHQQSAPPSPHALLHSDHQLSAPPLHSEHQLSAPPRPNAK